jgi:O-methyltransferase
MSVKADTDWHESTRHELKIFYGKVVVDGIRILNGYGIWSGSRTVGMNLSQKEGLNLF